MTVGLSGPMMATSSRKSSSGLNDMGEILAASVSRVNSNGATRRGGVEVHPAGQLSRLRRDLIVWPGPGLLCPGLSFMGPSRGFGSARRLGSGSRSPPGLREVRDQPLRGPESRPQPRATLHECESKFLSLHFDSHVVFGPAARRGSVPATEEPDTAVGRHPPELARAANDGGDFLTRR